MFSKRFSSSAKNRFSDLLDQKRKSGEHILDLTESNPTRVGLSYPEKEILEALSDPAALRYEPSPRGLEEATAAVATYYAERGYAVSPSDIFLTSSTSEAYSHLFKLLADPGDAILVPRPSYPLFDFLACGEGIRTQPYPLVYQNRWEIHLSALEALVTPHTRGLILVNPNNPTGSFLKADEWKDLKGFTRRHGLAVVCDEVFFDYRLDGSVKRRTPVGQTEVLTFLLNGLSKALALPQMKLAWIVVGGPEKMRSEALDRLEVICDTFLSVSTPAQLLATRLLPHREHIQRQILDRLTSNLNALKDSIAGTAIDALAVEGGWYAILRFPNVCSDEEWALRVLSEGNVVVHPGYFFEFQEEPFLVLSLLTPEGSFHEGLARILETVSRLTHT